MGIEPEASNGSLPTEALPTEVLPTKKL